jgi:prolyl-tRNA synthetase
MERIYETCVKVSEKLKDACVRVEIDSREEITPGSKFFDWELKGVPIRVEIGPRDVEKAEAIIVRRDTFEKTAVKLDELTDHIEVLMKKMAKDMREKAWKWMKEHIHKTDNLGEVKQLLKNRAGIVEVPWCGETNCGLKMEEEINGKVLGMPMDEKEKVSGNCIVCGKKAQNVVRVAVAY